MLCVCGEGSGCVLCRGLCWLYINLLVKLLNLIGFIYSVVQAPTTDWFTVAKVVTSFAPSYPDADSR